MTHKTNPEQPSVVEDSVDTRVNSFIKEGRDFSNTDTEEFKLAVKSEQRRRETQAEYTKTRQELKRVRAEKEALLSKVTNNTNISADKQAELEDLKHTDPDAWLEKMTQAREEAKNATLSETKKLLEEVGTKASSEFQIELRKSQLEAFRKETGIQINDEVIANDVPPRITRKLEQGKISFEQFLLEAANYIGKDKVLGSSAKAPDSKQTITKAGGSSSYTKNTNEPVNNDDYLL